MEKEVKLAIIGCGKLIDFFIIKALKKINGIKIVALCDINKKRLKIVSKKLNVNKLYNNYSDLLKDKEIDAIYIATPPNLHEKIILEAIQNKKHILCEKPLTINYKEALNIKNNLDKNLIILPAHNYSYSPCFEWAKEIINSGKLGKVKKIQNYFDININLWNNISKHQFNTEFGGVLYDHFAHLVYTCEIFGGKFDIINSIKTNKNKNIHNKVEIKGISNLGIESEIRASWNNLFFDWDLKIICENGYIQIDPQKTPHWIKVFDNKGKIIEVRKEKSFLNQLLNGYKSYQLEFEDFINAIKNNSNPKIFLDDAIETMKLIDTIKNLEI